MFRKANSVEYEQKVDNLEVLQYFIVNNYNKK